MTGREGRGPGTLILLFMAMVALPRATLAQLPDSIPVPPIPQEEAGSPEEAQVQEITPGGAFLRSALLPGWGHTRVGAVVRGAFYFSAEAATGLMIFKTQTRIDRTRNRLKLREAVETARLEAQGITDPAAIESALAEDPEVEDLRALEETRLGQREDWIALGLFLMLIGGVDAYVSAHLADFPAAVVVEPTPDRGVELGLSLPVGGR